MIRHIGFDSAADNTAFLQICGFPRVKLQGSHVVHLSFAEEIGGLLCGAGNILGLEKKKRPFQIAVELNAELFPSRGRKPKALLLQLRLQFQRLGTDGHLTHRLRDLHLHRKSLPVFPNHHRVIKGIRMKNRLLHSVAVKCVPGGPGNFLQRGDLKQRLCRKNRIWIEFQHNSLLP